MRCAAREEASDEINFAATKLPLVFAELCEYLQLQTNRLEALTPQVTFAAANLLQVLQMKNSQDSFAGQYKVDSVATKVP